MVPRELKATRSGVRPRVRKEQTASRERLPEFLFRGGSGGRADKEETCEAGHLSDCT